MSSKFRFIFLPTLFTLAGLIFGYTLLHWAFIINLELLSIKEFVTNFGVPMGLAGLAAWFIVRPRLKILNLEVKRGNWKDFYTFILWIVLLLPTIIAQEYIVSASGSLTELNSINDINQSELTKFYKLKNFYIDKKVVGVHSAFDASGKYNQDLNMHLYVAMPIFGVAADTANNHCIAWLGVEYKKTISNRLEEKEKEELYQQFTNESQQDFDKSDFSNFVYLDRIGGSDKRDGLLEAIKKNQLYEPSEILLIPVHESFEKRNGSKLQWVFGSSLIGLFVWLIMVLIPKVDQTQLSRIEAGMPDKEVQQDMKDFSEFAKPRDGFFITPLLIYANLIIFFAMVFSGLGFISFKGEDLLTWGANFGPLTKDGEWWRLFTSTFLHGGVMHVAANMYGLLFVGIFLEPVLGKAKYLLTYLVTGILASIASIWWYESTVSVGASGAIFGLYGLFLALMLTKVFPPSLGKALLLSTVVFIGFNLIMGLVGGIDNAAHIGGLLSGFVIGLILSPALKKGALAEDSVGEIES
jgi:rhomboid protease GluP